MLKRPLIVIIIILAFVWGAVPLSAQELTPEQQELFDILQDAFSAVRDASSFRSSGEQSISQIITVTSNGQTLTLEQDIDQTLDGQVSFNDENGISASITLDQSLSMLMPGQPPTNLDMTMELVIFEGVLYVRVSNISPANMASFFPQGWVNLNEDQTSVFAGVINADQYVNMLSNQIFYEFTEEMVANIEVLEDVESEEGQTLKVYQVTLDTEALAGMEMMEQAIAAFNTGEMDMASFMEQYLQNTEMMLVIYIISDTNIIYRADTIMNTDMTLNDFAGIPGPVNLKQEMSSSLLYTDFNAPIEISDPTKE